MHRDFPAPEYYEIVCRNIFRVGLVPKGVLPFESDAVRPTDHLKRFSYAVVGEADDYKGLFAPYDEENTEEILQIDRATPGLDVFDVWLANANQPLYLPEAVEQARF